MTIPNSAILPALLMAAALLFTILAARLTPPGGHLPFVAGALASALLAWQLFADLRSAAGPTSAPPRQSRLLLLLGLLLAFLYLAGFALTLPLFVTLYWRFHAGAAWRASLLAGAASATLVLTGSSRWIDIPTHPGLLWSWLGSWSPPLSFPPL